MEQAQASPTPATIFSLFYNGRFVTTDISVCMDSRFDKTLKKCTLDQTNPGCYKDIKIKSGKE